MTLKTKVDRGRGGGDDETHGADDDTLLNTSDGKGLNRVRSTAKTDDAWTTIRGNPFAFSSPPLRPLFFH